MDEKSSIPYILFRDTIRTSEIITLCGIFRLLDQHNRKILSCHGVDHDDRSYDALPDRTDDLCSIQEKSFFDGNQMLMDILRRVTQCVRRSIRNIAPQLSSDSWVIQAVDIEHKGITALQLCKRSRTQQPSECKQPSDHG